MSVINLVYNSGPIAENCGNEWYCCGLVLSTMNMVVIVVMILMMVVTMVLTILMMVVTTTMRSGIAAAWCCQL